ncbi:MAG TPA: hypothetical protein DCL80_12120 [Balneola sp.]|nr:hypothetical protein [Bacteroidota bacterium]MAO77219.1 hypothetical protein [Balneola sp.]MBF65957.1 hypothetical protein [Balneola sp.]MBF66054.1 hypothetical protein [Balneola sp.]HAH51950.1 hypothetical protein [Balneola sp.]
MSSYVALIDFEHLDHPVFLKSLSQSLASHKSRKGILIHGDSEYTNRLMQTGMMREDARKRAVMDLNHRLVALFADHGVSTIGLHGYQKELVQKTESGLKLNKKVFNALPESPTLLISSLIGYENERMYIPPVELAQFLVNELDDHELVIFSQDHNTDIFTETSFGNEVKWNELEDEFKEKNLSEEQLKITFPAVLTTGISFSGWPNPKKAMKIT